MDPDDPWDMDHAVDPIDRSLWDDEPRFDVIYSGYRLRYDHDAGGWTCTCGRFLGIGICRHVIPFKRQQEVKVKECYL